MRIPNLFMKVLLVVIVIALSMSVDAQYNRRGGNNTSGNGTSMVEEAAKGVVNGVKGLFNKKKDKSEDKDKKEKKDKKKDKNKGSKSKSEPLASDDIELIVSGDGSTKEQATLAALRSAIEQAYGTFVSSNTQILNDELVKDEIVSISKGNIKRYDYLSESVINGKNYVTLKAVVSIGQLVSYAKSKGSSAELAGATFAMDVKMKKLNRDNATKAYDNFIEQLEMMVGQMFDYSIEVGELHAGRNGQGGVSNKLFLPVELKIRSNKNYENVRDFIWNTLPNLWLNSSERKEYENKGIQYIGVTRFYFDRNPCPEKCEKEEFDRGLYCFMTSPLYKSNKSLKKVLMKAFSFVIKDNLGSCVFIPRKESGGTYTVNIEGNRGSFDAYEIFDFDRFCVMNTRLSEHTVSMGWFDEGNGFFPFPIADSYNVQIKGYLSYSHEEIDKISNIEINAATDVNFDMFF